MLARADDLPAVYVTGAIQENQTWTADSVYVADRVEVPDGLTLTISAGTIVKVGYASGIIVTGGGTLNVEGADESNVVFTSLSDDGYGGDTNADGPSNGLFGDYGTAISGEGGIVNAQYVTVRNGSSALATVCNTGNGTISLTDSQLYTPVSLTNCLTGSVILERNHFAVPQGYPIGLELGDANVLTLAGQDRNTFTGSGITATAFVINNNKVPAGTTWTVDSSGGLKSLVVSDLNVKGTIDINPGVVIKTGGGYALNVLNGGTVLAQGSAGNPVIFTSTADDTVGGDSTDDGLMLPTGPDYSSAINATEGGATVTLSNVKLAYANLAVMLYGGTLTASDVTATDVDQAAAFWGSAQGDMTDFTVSNAAKGISVVDGSEVVFRGTFSNISGKAIEACTWENLCSVDATLTEWGSEDGPFATSEAMVCGQVQVSPWIHDGDTYIDTQGRQIPDCEDVSFLSLLQQE
jgi:hypothetical protein